MGLINGTVIVGGGPAGIFCAYELIQQGYTGKITILEMGSLIEKRHCPKDKTGKCVHCTNCSVTSGVGGAGAWSDSKLTISPEAGGYLPELIGAEKTQALINYVDSIYQKFGMDVETVGAEDTEEIRQIRRRAIAAGLKLVKSPVKHLGTEKSRELYFKIEQYLLSRPNVTVIHNCEVRDLVISWGRCSGVITSTGERYYADNTILAVGRRGASWLEGLTAGCGIESTPGTVDIGVRVECRNEIMEEINECLYEGKFIGYPAPFRDKVRTFCQNPGGFVTQENYDNNLALVNGHAFKEKKSENTNLSILCSHNFTTPFDQPIRYAQEVGELTNMLAKGSILVQRYGDIMAGKRTWQEELDRSNLKPTLPDAVAGDITAAMPYRAMTSILAFIKALDKVVPGFAADETLLYSPEIKFYSNRIKMDEHLRTSIKNLFCIGDGAGITHGIMQASSMGVQCAREIMKWEETTKPTDSSKSSKKTI